MVTLKRILTRLCAGAALLVTLSGCSIFEDEPDRTRGWPVQRLYGEAKAALADGDYETAIDYYEKLEQRYPFGAFAQQAQLDVAYAYYKFQEPAARHSRTKSRNGFASGRYPPLPRKTGSTLVPLRSTIAIPSPMVGMWLFEHQRRL